RRVVTSLLVPEALAVLVVWLVDDAAGEQCVDVTVAVTGLPQDLPRVLANQRRRPRDAAARVRERDEVAELPHRAKQRVLVVGDEAEAHVVVVVQRGPPVDGVDGKLVRDAGVVEQAGPRPGRTREEPGCQLGLERGPVTAAGVVGRGALVVGGRFGAQHSGEGAPVLVTLGGDADPRIVLRAVEPVEGAGATEIDVEPRVVPRLAGGVQPHVGREDHAAVVQRGPQLLALAGALPV